MGGFGSPLPDCTICNPNGNRLSPAVPWVAGVQAGEEVRQLQEGLNELGLGEGARVSRRPPSAPSGSNTIANGVGWEPGVAPPSPWKSFFCLLWPTAMGGVAPQALENTDRKNGVMEWRLTH